MTKPEALSGRSNEGTEYQREKDRIAPGEWRSGQDPWERRGCTVEDIGPTERDSGLTHKRPRGLDCASVYAQQSKVLEVSLLTL